MESKQTSLFDEAAEVSRDDEPVAKSFEERFHENDGEPWTVKDIVIEEQSFRDLDISEFSFINVTFLNCDFSYVTADYTTFDGCQFYHRESNKSCNFFNASLTQTKFLKCDISMCNFSRADLFGIEMMDCLVRGADFSFADFVRGTNTKSSFSSAALKKSDFQYCDFEGVNLSHCDLSESRFAGVNLSAASFDGATLTNGVLAPDRYENFTVKGIDLRHTEIRNIDLLLLDISGVQIQQWQQETLLEFRGVVVHNDV